MPPGADAEDGADGENPVPAVLKNVAESPGRVVVRGGPVTAPAGGCVSCTLLAPRLDGELHRDRPTLAR